MIRLGGVLALAVAAVSPLAAQQSGSSRADQFRESLRKLFAQREYEKLIEVVAQAQQYETEPEIARVAMYYRSQSERRLQEIRSAADSPFRRRLNQAVELKIPVRTPIPRIVVPIQPPSPSPPAEVPAETPAETSPEPPVVPSADDPGETSPDPPALPSADDPGEIAPEGITEPSAAQASAVGVKSRGGISPLIIGAGVAGVALIALVLLMRGRGKKPEEAAAEPKAPFEPEPVAAAEPATQVFAESDQLNGILDEVEPETAIHEPPEPIVEVTEIEVEPITAEGVAAASESAGAETEEPETDRPVAQSGETSIGLGGAGTEFELDTKSLGSEADPWEELPEPSDSDTAAPGDDDAELPSEIPASLIAGDQSESESVDSVPDSDLPRALGEAEEPSAGVIDVSPISPAAERPPWETDSETDTLAELSSEHRAKRSGAGDDASAISLDELGAGGPGAEPDTSVVEAQFENIPSPEDEETDLARAGDDETIATGQADTVVEMEPARPARDPSLAEKEILPEGEQLEELEAVLDFDDESSSSSGPIDGDSDLPKVKVFHKDETVHMLADDYSGEDTLPAGGISEREDTSRARTEPSEEIDADPSGDPFERARAQGMKAFEEERWDRALHHLSVASALRPEANDVKMKLRETRRRRKERK